MSDTCSVLHKGISGMLFKITGSNFNVIFSVLRSYSLVLGEYSVEDCHGPSIFSSQCQWGSGIDLDLLRLLLLSG